MRISLSWIAPPEMRRGGGPRLWKAPIMFFDNWTELARILIVGGLAYVGLVSFLRVSGKRTLAKMNAFDLVVTVALGSTLATSLLDKNVSLLEGLLAFALLCGLQYTVAYVSVRSKMFRRIIKSEPALLLHRGEYLRSTMRRERVSEDEIRAAVRSAGEADPHAIEAVVLETDGTFSVIAKTASGSSSLGGLS
jgi:uncharacterized membrane protein YcaP (DUF421 family)